jgi:glycosyltransferase involved in cell wall biosynthesis
VADFAARVIRIRPDRLLVIPNGISLEDVPPADPAEARAILGLSADTLVMGTVGRLQPVKGTRYLLEAFTQLAAVHEDVVLLLVGDGPERASLQVLAQQLGIAKSVRFLGDRQDVSRCLHTMDVFVLPSIWEGMPNAALEAMAVGLPVVATAAGGTPEVVVDGVTGLLVPPRDPDALARAVARLLRDSDLRRTMGQAGRVRAKQRFSIEETVRRTEELYTTLLKEKGH